MESGMSYRTFSLDLKNSNRSESRILAWLTSSLICGLIPAVPELLYGQRSAGKSGCFATTFENQNQLLWWFVCLRNRN